MWDHWRGGIFTDSETLNNENELLKCILEKQRKEMMLLAKQIAALTKRKENIGDKKENCEAEQVSADWSELGPDEDDQSEVVTWALEAEMITNQDPDPVETNPAKLAPISTPQLMKSSQSTADSFSPMSIVDRTHQCKYCSKRFASAKACKRHERIHTDTRPFSCTFCPRTFTRKDLLTTHTRCHSKEKPYICPLCNTGFARSDVRTKHIKTHVENGECTMAEAKKKLGNVTVGLSPTQNLRKSQQQLQQQSPVPAIINQTPSIPITFQQTGSVSEIPEPTAISDPPKMVQYQIVQIVQTLQPQFRIEALRKQPRKIAPKRSRSPDPAGCSRAVRKTRKLRNIAAKQKRSNA